MLFSQHFYNESVNYLFYCKLSPLYRPSEETSILDSFAELRSSFFRLSHLLIKSIPTSETVHSLKSRLCTFSCKNCKIKQKWVKAKLHILIIPKQHKIQMLQLLSDLYICSLFYFKSLHYFVYISNSCLQFPN